ncbi:hypothetical protein BC831DRAFT_288398 [Entophlyctis helioformis]|nr:hypothetical protein BC831DRAFT_288398 [Entophlyctis helioformis]
MRVSWSPSLTASCPSLDRPPNLAAARPPTTARPSTQPLLLPSPRQMPHRQPRKSLLSLPPLPTRNRHPNAAVRSRTRLHNRRPAPSSMSSTQPPRGQGPGGKSGSLGKLGRLAGGQQGHKSSVGAGGLMASSKAGDGVERGVAGAAKTSEHAGRLALGGGHDDAAAVIAGSPLAKARVTSKLPKSVLLASSTNASSITVTSTKTDSQTLSKTRTSVAVKSLTVKTLMSSTSSASSASSTSTATSGTSFGRLLGERPKGKGAASATATSKPVPSIRMMR